MSATIQANKTEYVALMRKFASSEIDGKLFREEFTTMRDRDLQKDGELLKAWPDGYKIKLLDAYQQGEISKKEFDKKWHELWGFQPTRWLEIFDAIFDELDRFEPDQLAYQRARKAPEVDTRTYYITENQLRDTVQGYLQEIGLENETG